MGNNENFARDFPQNAPHVSDNNTPKGQWAPRKGGIMKLHGSRKIRKVSGPGGRCKVLQICRSDDGCRNGKKMVLGRGRNTFGRSRMKVIVFVSKKYKNTKKTSSKIGVQEDTHQEIGLGEHQSVAVSIIRWRWKYGIFGARKFARMMSSREFAM